MGLRSVHWLRTPASCTASEAVPVRGGDGSEVFVTAANAATAAATLSTSPTASGQGRWAGRALTLNGPSAGAGTTHDAETWLLGAWSAHPLGGLLTG
jgi:hypothetical protein